MKGFIKYLHSLCGIVITLLEGKRSLSCEDDWYQESSYPASDWLRGEISDEECERNWQNPVYHMRCSRCGATKSVNQYGLIALALR